MEAGADALAEDEHYAGAVALQRIDDPTKDDDAGEWSLELYPESDASEDAVRASIAAKAQIWSKIAPGIIEELPDIDWVAHALQGLGVVRAGRFVLYGVHDTDKLPNEADDIPIRIDANEAFGTGHHPTTAGCLALLDRLAGFSPKNILDLGCGSAILAIAAAKLWDRNILAVDIDPRSVEIATDNAALNDIAEKIETLQADGFENDAVTSRSPFDFVFANILAGPLVELAPAMARHISKSGRLMLAGLMTEQIDGVITAYEKAGFRILNRIDQPTWPILLLVKP